ncbi:MAG: ABC transporter ATP-binding protein/permease [Oscillospiraceae bacterium]|nr:ABC transporter ATP-binding protein/permease [Oscillospiraceae bacterium]
MELCINKPEAAGEDVVYALPYNLSRENEMINGSFCVTREKILIYLDGKVIKEYVLDDFKEFECKQQAGSSMAQGRDKKGNIIFLCAFTQEYFLRYAELLKILDYYLRTGEFLTESDADEPFCPKCGHPLNGRKTCLFCTKKSSTILRLIKMLAPYKKEYAAAIICTIAAQLINIMIPYADRYIIDNYVTPKNEDWHSFAVIVTVVLSLILVNALLDFINMKCSFKAALGLGKDIRQQVFEKSQALSMSASAKRTAGEMISRVSGDAAKVEEFFTANGKDFVVQVFSMVILCVIIFFIDVRLAVMTVLPLPIVYLIAKKLISRMEVAYTQQWKSSVKSSELLHDGLSGIRVVKSYGKEQYEIDRYKKATDEWRVSSTRAETGWYRTYPIAQFLISLGSYFVLYFGGNMVLGMEMTIGELVQFSTYVSMLYAPVEWLIRIPRTLADTTVSAGKVFEVLDEEAEVADSDNAGEIDIKGDISFKNVYFGYKVYNPVLKDISFDIKQGEMIGVVGHSGAGKSTLINLVMRLYDCTQGKITIDGVNIKEITQKCLRSQIGVVLQETFLFDGNILDNICYAKPDATFEEVVRAAKIANAHDFITKLPDGYNTRVGNKGYQLSGGERQRIAIARAILHDPKIIILDEATSALDTQTEKQIQEALGRLIKGRTTIAIAHRLSTLSSADRLLVLDKGRLAEFGTHNELMKQKGVYYKLVMAQRQTTKMKAAVTASEN